jgi:hypothetical protein
VTLLLIPELSIVVFLGVRLCCAGRLNIRIAATLAGLTGSLVALARGIDAGVSWGDSALVAVAVGCLMWAVMTIYLVLRRRTNGSSGAERLPW